MNILFIESYPQVIYGQQRTLLRLLQSVTERGHRVTVACTGEGDYVNLLKQEGFAVELIPYPNQLSSYGGAIYEYKGIRKLKCYAQGIGYIWQLRKRLKELSPDAIYCNDMRGLLTVGVAAKSLSIPVMIWDKLDKPHGWLDTLQLPLVGKNLVISDAVCSKYPSYQQRWFRKKIIKVAEGVDLDVADQGRSIRETLPGADDDILVGIVGSISERKGHDRLFQSFKLLSDQLPNLRLFVVGDVSDEGGEEFKSSLPCNDHERVHFLGMREDVADLMKSFDFLVVPSRQEGMGMVIVEAMAANLPVIGARAGGIPEVIVDGETGIIFDGSSQEDLTAAIEKLATEPELRQMMGSAGRKRSEEQFNRPVQMAKVVNLLESLA